MGGMRWKVFRCEIDGRYFIGKVKGRDDNRLINQVVIVVAATVMVNESV